MLFTLIPEPWRGLLADFQKDLDRIGNELRTRADTGERILPDRKDVFRALELAPSKVRVIIVGQDPYPNSSDAMGLAFSVKPRTSGLPASLMNIQKEIITDIGATSTSDGDLTRWSTQGVLLLNRVLTVTAGESASHQNLGWQPITEKIVQYVASNGAIGVLWGNSARELSRYFSEDKLIEGVHPSPLSAHRGFLGSRPFSRINEILEKENSPEIVW